MVVRFLVAVASALELRSLMPTLTFNFLIFILSFQHVSEILKMSSRVALDLDFFQWI